MQMSPVIAIHLSAALGALALGPVALWARQGHTAGDPARQRPRLHRAAGYAWVTLMLMTAVSALFIRDFELPNIAGYTPIHMLVPVVFGSLFMAYKALQKGDVKRHRGWMSKLYLLACMGAGAGALLPNRILGQLIWTA